MDYKDVMNRASPSFGVCSYKSIEQRLIPCRALSRIPDGACSVIVAAFPYLLDKEKYIGGNISKYASVKDYHTVINGRLLKAVEELSALYPDDKFVTFTDNSPVPEVSAALMSGMGAIGDNGLFIHDTYGTFVFLGEIVTTLEIEPTGNGVRECLHCGACRRACPTGAIGDRGPDPAKCLSAINQKKGELTEYEKKLIKESGCAWGCDRCQDVCPLNANAKITDMEEFIEGACSTAQKGEDLEGKAYGWRGRSVIERNLDILENE